MCLTMHFQTGDDDYVWNLQSRYTGPFYAVSYSVLDKQNSHFIHNETI